VFGGVLPTFMMLLVMTSPLPGRARVAGLAVFSLAASAGLGLAALVAAWLIDLGGWRGLFWGQALAGLLYTALAFLVLPGERGDPAPAQGRLGRLWPAVPGAGPSDDRGQRGRAALLVRDLVDHRGVRLWRPRRSSWPSG
jgi:MFS family permease